MHSLVAHSPIARTSAGLLGALVFSAALTTVSCSSPNTPTAVTLLDTTVTMVAGVTCNNGGVSTDFNGTATQTVLISATGASTLTPRFTLYAPDFTRQLAGSTANSAGSAALMIALTETGQHHITLCDLNGVAGTLRVKVVVQ